MFLVREVFHCEPGKAKELVKIFKHMMKDMEESGVKNVKIMTDAVYDYWTVVMESEIEDLNFYIDMGRKGSENAKKETPKEGSQEQIPDYRDLVIGGYREVFRLE